MAIQAFSSPPPAKTSTPMSKARTAGAAWVRPTADWQLGDATDLMTDFEYQHKVERSEAGYQLLGGTTVPAPVYPSVMLGFQPWSKPNTFDTFNAGARLQHKLAANWSLRFGGSYSHSLIDDNVIWPYGAALDANGNSLCPNSPLYFFCPDGSYEIYDYRSPGELRIDALGEALVLGHFTTGKISHDVVGGGSLFHRSVDLSPTIVYTPLGVENIYQPNIAYAPESPYQQAGPSTLADFNHQGSAIVQDRVHLPGNVVLQAGGRVCRRSTRLQLHRARATLWLPQYASHVLARSHDLTLYGNYGVLLSLGPQAPVVGRQREPVSCALHHTAGRDRREIRARNSAHRGSLPHARAVLLSQGHTGRRQLLPDQSSDRRRRQPGDLCFESEGHETHDGIELNARGQGSELAAADGVGGGAARDLQPIQAHPHSTTSRSSTCRTCTPLCLRMSLLPHAHGLHLMPGWSYTGRKEATRDDLRQRRRLQPVQPGRALHARRRKRARDAAPLCR